MHLVHHLYFFVNFHHVFGDVLHQNDVIQDTDYVLDMVYVNLYNLLILLLKDFVVFNPTTEYDDNDSLFVHDLNN